MRNRSILGVCEDFEDERNEERALLYRFFLCDFCNIKEKLLYLL